MYRARRGYIPGAYLRVARGTQVKLYLYKRQALFLRGFIATLRVHALPFMNIPHGGIFYCIQCHRRGIVIQYVQND